MKLLAIAGLLAITLVSVEDEIAIGRQANVQVQKQIPALRDEQTLAYVRSIGQRLARHAPGPGYPYSFSTADYREINAFALPPVNTQGNLGRNTVIGPGLVAIDASLSKKFQLGETRTLQFRTEVFNLPNHPNFSIPSGLTSFTNATGAVSPTFGKITSTTTTSRQIQFGLKLTF